MELETNDPPPRAANGPKVRLLVHAEGLALA